MNRRHTSADDSRLLFKIVTPSEDSFEVMLGVNEVRGKMVAMTNALKKLEQIRQWRARRVRDISIKGSIQELQQSLQKNNKQLSQIIEAWDELLPINLKQNVLPTSLRGGVLEVTADGSPTAYQFNRLIRSGLLREMQKRSNCTLRQIRVRITR